MEAMLQIPQADVVAKDVTVVLLLASTEAVEVVEVVTSQQVAQEVKVAVALAAVPALVVYLENPTQVAVAVAQAMALEIQELVFLEMVAVEW
jgi:hypothetical protein